MRASRFVLGLMVAGLISGCTPAEVAESTTSTSSPVDVAELEEKILDLQTEELRAQVDVLEEALRESQAEMKRIRGRETELQSALATAKTELALYQEELAQLRELASMPETPEAQAALSALEGFLAAMRTGDYATAARLYAGSLEAVTDWNPAVDASDEVALLEAACHQLRCDLQVRRFLPGFFSGDIYELWVEFETADGELFTRGPCCGDDSGAPPETQFLFTVVAKASEFGVTALPVYVP